MSVSQSNEWSARRARQPQKLTSQRRAPEEVPVVTIVCIAYNHARFVAEAIEGFLLQETSFPVEIIIHDDASSDTTADIIRSYEKRYPHLIRSVLRRENQMGAGKAVLRPLLQEARGEFIAFCEADDYWTSPNKLESQVERLREDPRRTFAAHAVEIVGADGRRLANKGTYHTAKTGPVRFVDVLHSHFIPTLSLMFRRTAVARLPDCYERVLNGDIVLALTFTAHGEGWFDRYPMGVYRQHAGGITKVRRTPLERWTSDRILYEGMDAYTGEVYHRDIHNQLAVVDCRYGLRLMRSGAIRAGIRMLVKTVRADPPVLLRLLVDRLRLMR